MSSWFDFNTAEKMGGELIPANTVAPVVMSLRSGGSAKDPMLRQSQSSDALMLDAEFTIAEGPYARRKVFQFITLDGGKRDDAGNSIGGGIGRSFLRAALESARNIKPDDSSPEAQKARTIAGYQDLEGLTFLAKIGIQKSKDPQYSDKNAITPVTNNMKEWSAGTTIAGTSSNAPSTQPNAPATGAAPWASQGQQQSSAPAGNGTPSWAQ